MTANVITYRGRSAAREVGKALSLEPAQVDRLAKVMNHFEWVDPKETLERNLREVGLDFQRSDHPAVRPTVAADPGSAAPSRSALRRHGDVPRPPRRHRAARERQHARPGRRPVGQGRLRRHGHRQGRSARPGHDGGAAGCAGAGEYEQDWDSGSGPGTPASSGLGTRARDRGSEVAATQATHGRPGCYEPERPAPTQAGSGSRAPRSRSSDPRASSHRRRSRRSTGCCRKRTRSGSSRSSRARRWRRCRGCVPSASTTSSSRSRSSGRGRSSGRWCIRI